MSIKLKKEHLQNDKYNYTWSRDKGDSSYTGTRDRVRIDKDEGYEVLPFVENIMNDHSLGHINDVHRIENALHDPSLSSIVMRDDLTNAIERMLSL